MNRSSLAATLTAHDDFFHAAHTTLHEVFGCSFDFWSREEAWVRVGSGSPDLAAHPTPEDAEDSAEFDRLLVGTSAATAEPHLESLGEQWRLAVPIRRDNRVALIATATFDGGSSEVLLRLAQSFMREFAQRQQLVRFRQQLEQSRSENDELIVQVADSLEELSFLRNLLKRLEISEVDFDLRQVVATVLPPLAEAVRCESLALVLAEPAAAPHLNVRAGVLLFRTGGETVSDETCGRLVEQFQASAQQQPAIRNRFDEHDEHDEHDAAADFPGVLDFILTSVLKGERPIGWILALNRTNRQAHGSPSIGQGLGANEFGSEDATLLGSTATMLSTQVKNAEVFREKERLLVNVVRAIVTAIDAKDPFTIGKSERVADYAMQIGRELTLGDRSCERLYLTGLLHDVGQIGISDATLRKPGRLTPAEAAEIKRHPQMGWDMLKELKQLSYVLPGILSHHERFDGKGYPLGLTGDEIPLEGRILAVADAYDAMVNDRSYRKGMPQPQVETILREGAGAQWDPNVIAAFLRIMPEIVRVRETL